MSVGASSLGGLSSTRAQSSATLPIPHMATLSTSDRSTADLIMNKDYEKLTIIRQNLGVQGLTRNLTA